MYKFIKTKYAWLPTRVRTSCSGYWKTKLIWFEHYDEDTVELTSINQSYKAKYIRDTNE